MPVPPAQPLDALFRPPALIAAVLAGEALAFILALAPGQSSGRLVAFGLASLGIQWVALGTLCALFLLRRALSRTPAMWLAWVCLGLLLAITLLIASAAWSLLGMEMDLGVGRTSFVLRMLALAFVVGLMALLIYQNYWQTRQLAVRAKQLELEALQARIRPHFLFNTLNTGAALVHARPADAERLLLDLADLFRCALRGPQQIPLAEELALTRRYLEIEALRFGDRLRLHWEIPETMPEVLVPSLSIQPLAENAIRHGIERRPEGGAVDVAVRLFGDRVEITVANDMPGIAGGGGGHAVGLASARERVRAFSDGRGDVETRLLDGRHIATMTLPLQEQER